MWAYMASSGDITAPLAGPPVNRTLLPVKQLAAAPFTVRRRRSIKQLERTLSTDVFQSEARNEIHSKQFIETAAQFTSLPANPIKLSAGSAFGPLVSEEFTLLKRLSVVNPFPGKDCASTTTVRGGVLHHCEANIAQ